jgi:hypothetical protein
MLCCVGPYAEACPTGGLSESPYDDFVNCNGIAVLVCHLVFSIVSLGWQGVQSIFAIKVSKGDYAVTW